MPHEVEQVEAFRQWLVSLRDRNAAAVIARRIDRMRRGNFGDAKSVGDGISEMRIDVGPGYRVYFVLRGNTKVFLLGGGDKDSQRRDIKAAKALAKEI